jgi:exopolysaccharide biosynthesis polyprenyl glycosylphosphotransferase
MDERMKRKTMRDYARGVILVDFLVLLATTLIVYLENYGSFQIVDNIYDEGLFRITASPQLVGVGLLVTWLILLSVFKSRDPKIVGSDFSEYRRVLNATLSVLGLLAFVSLYFKVDVSRLYVTEVLLIGLVALLVARRLGRNWLNKQRKQGNFTRRVAIYGPTSELALELKKYSSHKESEFEPIMTIEDNKLLVLKYLNSDKTQTVDLEHLPEVLTEENIELLQVVGSGPSSAQMHKKLYWALDGWDISFVVSPAITGVSSSKLTTRVIAGSPLIKISSTKFSGPQYFVKTTFDILFSIIALIIASPVMLATAVAIKVTDRGPIFFKQTRIGLNGTEFQILKFRSMKVGAEKEFDELAAKAGYEVNSVQFKLKDDPRITKVGKFIRKTSIDELPQFLNVLKGDMSVVGPRPHVHKEVNSYGEYDGRRLLVKPGITGPWQVGGRSELTWEESVAIDLSYVENWNWLSDISIIVKTVFILTNSKNAY